MIIRTTNCVDKERKLIPDIKVWDHSKGTLWSFDVTTDMFGNEVSFVFTSHAQIKNFLSQIGTAYVKALQTVEDERLKFIAENGITKLMEKAYGDEE